MRDRDPSLVTFLGPIQKKGDEYLFRVVQSGGAVPFAFPTYREARRMRSTLAQEPRTYKVPTEKLLSAIAEAVSSS